MISFVSVRRIVLATALMMSVASTAMASELLPMPEKDKRGLHTQSWFKATTGDLRKDLAAAQAEEKILTILWEQKGCSYCRKLHEVNFRNHDTVDYIKKNFYVVQMNMRGDRTLIGFDGNETSESDYASENVVTGTPTAQFFKQDSEEVFRLPGYANPPVLRYVFEYVATGAYETAGVMDWLKVRMADSGEKAVN